MDSTEVIADAFERIREVVHAVVADLDPAHADFRPDGETNSVAWLVWHLTRVQDDHVASAANTTQVWADGGWVDKFALPFDSSDIGYGMSPAEVELVVVEPVALLREYHDAVCERTLGWIRGLTATDLDRVLDENYDPPVTLGARLVSVIGDDLQHAGQAAFLRGIAERRR